MHIRVMASSKLQAALAANAGAAAYKGPVQCRIWVRARLLRGSSPTLRSLRLKVQLLKQIPLTCAIFSLGFVDYRIAMC